MSFIGGVEADGKTMANNFITNAGALVLFQKVIAPYVVKEGDSEIVRTLKAAGVLTAIEEFKAWALRAGLDLRLFK